MSGSRMSPQPTGRLHRHDGGRDLVLTRSFATSVDDVWASITESDRTARWFASWTGDPGSGNTIHYTMTFEEGAPQGDMVIDVCDPPSHLAITTIDEYGTWRLEAKLTHGDGATVLTLMHHLDESADIGSVGPGWEYYLDMLVAAEAGDTLPDFGDYYPAQRAYYDGLS